jgi:hypothetical protein
MNAKEELTKLIMESYEKGIEDTKQAAIEGIQKAILLEREAIMDEWWMCVQSDLENGVKSLNERAAEKWKKEYPAIAGFAATIEARGST